MRRSIEITLAGLVLMLGSCSTQQTPAPAGPGPAPAANTAPAPEPAASPDAPADVSIGDLVVDKQRVIRIKGVISAIVGMRLVPPKVIFKVTDDTGTVLVLINEKAQLSEGTRMELVGHYKSIPSPTYGGPDEAPPQNIFVVDRYLDLP